MRLSLLVALLLALGCSKKAEDPVARVCKHIHEVCGALANVDACVASANAMRAANLEGAKEAELCALEKKTCQEISMCSMKGGKRIIRTSLRNAKQALEQAKKQLESSPEPAAPAPAE